MSDLSDQIAALQVAREQGMLMQKEYLIKQAELWCNSLSESAAFHPDQKVKEGQVRNAFELLEYLKK